MRKVCKQILAFILVYSFLFAYFPESVIATHGFGSGPMIVTINGMKFTLYGYAGDGPTGPSFRMMDIAYILNGTRAQFDFDGYWLARGVPYIASGAEFLPITERRFALFGSYGLVDSHGLVVTRHGERTWPSGLTTTVYDVFTTIRFKTHWGFGRSVAHDFSAVHDIDYLYFSLAELGRVLGFSHSNCWFANAVINTYEPLISEYGFARAQDFFQSYPMREYFSYFFQDFTGCGVPVIFVQNAEVTGDSKWYYMYVYVDGNFNRQGQLGSHEFFRCRDGNVYLFNLMPYEDDRLTMMITPMMFSEAGVEWGEAISDDEPWDGGFIPALPGYREDFNFWISNYLTSIRPFYQLYITPPPPAQTWRWLIEPVFDFDSIRWCSNCGALHNVVLSDAEQVAATLESYARGRNVHLCSGHRAVPKPEYFVDESQEIFATRTFVRGLGYSMTFYTPEELHEMITAGRHNPLRFVRRMNVENTAVCEVVYEASGVEMYDFIHNIGGWHGGAALYNGAEQLTEFVFYHRDNQTYIYDYCPTLGPLIAVRIDGFWGVVDANVNFVVPFEFDNIEFVSDTTAFARHSGLYGVLAFGENVSSFFIPESDAYEIKFDYTLSGAVHENSSASSERTPDEVCLYYEAGAVGGRVGTVVIFMGGMLFLIALGVHVFRARCSHVR